ncbi:hypothetical protein BGZ76_009794 [Entomortierella beljakovae]|nr:hypothetical protein BGZ76_009794 [Entomortierella beljakovae]
MGARPNSTTETGTGHPWKKFVKAFINLEGGGSGGPSLLFRGTDYDIIRHYADNAPFPHASVFVNDVFKFGLINSDTDYSIFIEHGLPGLDIAFYQRRAMYHTSTDTLPITSLYHMGSNALATITGLCNSDYLDSPKLLAGSYAETMPISPRLWVAGKSIFYDLLGKQMVFSDLWTILLVNALMLGLGLPVLALTIVYAGRAIRRRQYNRRPTRPSMNQNPAASLRTVIQSSSTSMGNSDDGYGSVSIRPNNARQHGRQIDADNTRMSLPRKTVIFKATSLVALIMLFDIAAIIYASKWQLYINPLVRFSHPWLVLAGLACLLLVVNTIMVYLITVIESIDGQVPISRGATQWTLAIGVWWWFIAIVIGTGLSGWFGIGALYGTSVLAAFAGVAALVQVILNFSNSIEGMDDSKFGWILVLGLGLLVPVYVLYGVFLIPVLLPAIPVISRGRNFKTALIWEVIALALIAWWLSQVEPFNSHNPSALYFYQHYDQTSQSSTVDLLTDSSTGYIQLMIQDVPIDELSQCIPTAIEDGSPYNEICSFVPNRQVFEDDGKEKPIQFNWTSISERGLNGWRESHLEVLAPESRACSIYLGETSPGRETRIQMKGEDSSHTTDNHRSKALHVYARNWNTWTAIIRVKEPEQDNNGIKKKIYQPVPLKITCAYNDWYSGPGYASVFNEIRTQVPNWVRMRMHKRDLFEVSVETTM